MKRFISILLMTAVLSGCASWFPNTGNYEKMLDGWVGRPSDELVKSWGPPRGSYRLSNGETVMDYYESHEMRTDYTPFFYNGNERIGVETLWCKTVFVIDRNGNVASWKHEGNDCVAGPQK